MFFIGIFGSDISQKQIGVYNNTICPACGAFTHLEIYKTYAYFHIFFIPIYKWNVKYYVKSHCCANVFELSTELGKRFESGEKIAIGKEHLSLTGVVETNRICSGCGVAVKNEYKFCPYCGKKYE